MSTSGERVVHKPHVVEIEREERAEQLSERVRSLRLPAQSAERRGGSPRVAWVLCVLLCIALGVLAFLYFRHPFDSVTEMPPESPKPAAPRDVAAASAEKASSGEFALQAKGYIITTHQILVSPKVSGMIVKLNIIESQRVKKNDVLAELEDTLYRAERDRAQANLMQAKAHLTRCKSDHARADTLLPTKAISKSDFDLSRSNLEEAAAAEKLAQAELDKAEWQLSNCIIRAPVTGTILKKNAEEGSLVNPIAMQGFYSLCEMADLSDLEVDLTIQERDISRIYKGQQCKIRAEAYPDRVYDGFVSRLMPTADRAKGAIPVRVKVNVPTEEEGIYLKPEMGALVSFLKKADSESEKKDSAKPKPR
jgi:HlyD family secretion protein